MNQKKLRTNREIHVREVRLIDEEGNQKGIISTMKALQIASSKNLDLVEVSPNTQPPVCRIQDYGKFRYEMEKRLREQKKTQTQTRLKEVRMQPKIGLHDLEVKAKQVQEFLDGGNKVKVTIRFRGRENAHTELGKDVLERLMGILEEKSFGLDNQPRMEGKFMSMLLSPKKRQS